MKEVELFKYPVKKAKERNLDKTLQEEMTDFELSFLCGLIREKKPRKILELGVAAGGSTAIIVECLNGLGIETEMFSVDISEQYYRNPSYPCGYRANDIIKETDCVNHKFLLGHSIPYVIEQIGDGIDFLVLDTAHILPGELLDFITVLPYLKDGCIVVMHDVNNSHYCGDMRKIATCLLFSGVSSKNKYRMKDESSKMFSFSNIAAFSVDGSTRENIEDLISLLLVPWSYTFSEVEKKQYLKIIEQFYNEEIGSVIKRCFLLQDNFSVKQMIVTRQIKDIYPYIESWKRSTCVFIYGAGYWARKFIAFAKEYSLPLDGCVVSDGHRTDETIDGIHVYELKELKASPIENPTFVLGVDRKNCEEIRKILYSNGFCSILEG